ncbi:MAG: hypothetical protein M0T84_15855 [Betaproteobacteria bacterium]|nr:hypothetical protein [Betaproteobacteria bacterium]
MQKWLVALAGTLAFSLSACQSTAAPPPAVNYPKISSQARQALSQAEADVNAAKAKHTLWTTTAAALQKAKRAAAKGENGLVIKESDLASQTAKLSLQQRRYPLIH